MNLCFALHTPFSRIQYDGFTSPLGRKRDPYQEKEFQKGSYSVDTQSNHSYACQASLDSSARSLVRNNHRRNHTSIYRRWREN